MAIKELSPGDDYYNTPNDLAQGGFGNRILGLEGDDTIIGSNDSDTLVGQEGDDVLQAQVNTSGYGDVLIGSAGNDALYGSSGVDYINGDNIKASDDNDHSDNQDYLYGGAGADDLRGGIGDDTYEHFMSDGGQEEINEDLSASGNTGYGSGDDDLFMSDVSSSDLRIYQSGSDLQVTDADDVADGSVDEGVEIKNFYDGGDDVVEELITSDNVVYDLTAFL